MNKQINPFAKKQIDAIEKFCAAKQPLVAIKCVTYNHEKYLKDALEGFVKQKTKFPFVAIVHDDASTDKTASILKEYADKYPDIILPIYETENQHSKFDGSLLRITTGALTATGAKYIAICEGDDYWTDPLKLQKQVDFLESHPDYALVFANVHLHYDYGKTEDTLPIETREYTAFELYGKIRIPTPTILFRSSVYTSTGYLHFSKIRKPVFGDLTLFMACALIGRIYGFNNVVCGYRRLSTGATNYLFANPYKLFRNRIALSSYLGDDFKNVDRERFVIYLIPALKGIFTNFPTNLKFISLLFYYFPIRCLRQLSYIPKGIIRRIHK